MNVFKASSNNFLLAKAFLDSISVNVAFFQCLPNLTDLTLEEEILVYGASDISVSLEAGVLVTFSIAPQ